MNDIVRITAGAANWPPQLVELKGGPKHLFVRGQPDLLTGEHLVAVVGPRKVTPYGRAVVQQMVQPWARAGLTIISGLALGTDALAHQATLAGGGRTMAVLGSGVDDDNITPRTNFNLAQQILANDGTIVSEYEPGTPADAWRFPARNRIVAGLAQVVVVIEGSMKSGTLITAKCMLDYGRDVFAVPGPITVESSRAPNWLISQGAHPLLYPNDLLEFLGVDSVANEAKQTTNLSKNARVVLKLIECDATSVDQLTEKAKLDTATILGAISELELSGAVCRQGDLYTVIH